jgi:uncharacterized membrane protein
VDRVVPFLAAALLDAVDLATWGPLGLSLGFVLGALSGWFLSESLGFKPQNRWMGAALGGVYCMTPGTSVLPVATVVTAVRQLSEKREQAPEQVSRGPGTASGRHEDAIDVDYRSVDDDELR